MQQPVKKSNKPPLISISICLTWHQLLKSYPFGRPAGCSPAARTNPGRSTVGFSLASLVPIKPNKPEPEHVPSDPNIDGAGVGTGQWALDRSAAVVIGPTTGLLLAASVEQSYCVSSLGASSPEADIQTPPTGTHWPGQCLSGCPSPRMSRNQGNDRHAAQLPAGPRSDVHHWPSPPRTVMSTPEPAHGTAHDKNKVPHTGDCGQILTTQTSEGDGANGFLGVRTQDPKQKTSHPMSLLGQAFGIGIGPPTPPIQGNHIIRRAAHFHLDPCATAENARLLSESPPSLVEQLAAASQKQTSCVFPSGIRS
ncbi:hypothetical protein QBC39DRAFT_334066 [Podospora conica]|nr:hypothetical protein QBC39DRAFT_334066 [Schizothecium conicum]